YLKRIGPDRGSGPAPSKERPMKAILVWAIGTDSEADGFGIFRWNGKDWDKVEGAATRIAVDHRGRPRVVHAEGGHLPPPVSARRNGPRPPGHRRPALTARKEPPRWLPCNPASAWPTPRTSTSLAPGRSGCASTRAWWSTGAASCPATTGGRRRRRN